MKTMVMKANYNNEYRGEEYSPTHFILEIEPSMVRHLRNLVKSVNTLKEIPGMGIELIDARFYFGFGIWTEFNEKLEELSEEELVFVDDFDSYFEENELQEQPYLSDCRISVDKAGNLQFFCFGKFDDERIYTCGLNISEIQTELGNRLLESL